jgi:ssDNA-binding Zn-finger/Zn-ribbon topoisomerase 1
MPERKHGIECPVCGKGGLKRRRRKFWMRLIPGSKHYLCNWCPARYLVIFDRAIRMFPQDK